MEIQAGLTWKPEYEVGDASMDAAHRDFVETVSSLLAATDAELPGALSMFREHAEQHFGEEDTLMRSGDYASAQCHLDEHQAVLASIREVQERVAAGDCAVGRRLARELARWFPEHTVAMDRGLAAWATKRRLGGHKVHFVSRLA
jgi:hemerythrin